MTIDKEYLDQTLTNLKAQRDQTVLMLGKVDGAIELATAMLAKLAEPAPSAEPAPAPPAPAE